MLHARPWRPANCCTPFVLAYLHGCCVDEHVSQTAQMNRVCCVTQSLLVVVVAVPQGPNRAVREREAIANLQHLANLKLLHPPRSREQIVRWQELLSETVALLRLLSASKTQPSNTADAAAAVLPAQGLTAAAVQARPEGLLHGVPQDDRKRREVWRALSSHVHRLLVLLDKEVREQSEEQEES